MKNVTIKNPKSTRPKVPTMDGGNQGLVLTPEANRNEREIIAMQTEQFLASGGKINDLGSCGNGDGFNRARTDVQRFT